MRQWNVRVLVQGGQEQSSIAKAHIQFRRRNAAIEPQRAVGIVAVTYKNKKIRSSKKLNYECLAGRQRERVNFVQYGVVLNQKKLDIIR